MWKRKLQMPSWKGSVTDTSTIPDDRLRMAADRFFAFAKTLHELDGRIQVHYRHLAASFDSRNAVLASLQSLSRQTPLQRLVDDNNSSNGNGNDSDAAAGEPAKEGTPEASDQKEPQPANGAATKKATTTYTDTVDAARTQALIGAFQADIVSYVREWDTTVSSRVKSELKNVMALCKAWERYQLKVEGLKASLAKKTTSKLQEKLTWNESKLRNAKREYRRNLIAVTLLTEEVTDRAWKELVPLMLRLIDFDMKSWQNARERSRQLLEIRQEMVQVARNYEMEFETIHKGRLRILREEDAVDFVDPEDLQDLESTLAGGSGLQQQPSSSGQPPLNGKPSGITPPCSSDEETTEDRDSDHPEDERAADASPQSHAKGPVDLDDVNNNIAWVDPYEDAVEGFECDDDGGIQYPRSIYVTGEGGSVMVDDETTLTGMPDLASV